MLSNGQLPSRGYEAMTQQYAGIVLNRLSPREREVAELVTQGLSDREISSRLVISRRTAESHVAHILTKLGFSSRVQVAACVASQS